NGAGSKADPTWVSPRFTPRKNVNPAARRRTIAVFALSLVVLGGLALAASILAARPTVKVPSLHGIGKAGVTARVHGLHLDVAFTKRYDEHAKPGTVVAQTPGPGTRIKQDSTIDVVLSNGPRPIEVPSLTGKSSSDAVGRLHHMRLGALIRSVPAPGKTP